MAFSTSKEKCEALACQFAKSHELTHHIESVADIEVNNACALYKNTDSIVNFSSLLPADFRERENLRMWKTLKR